MKSRYLRVLLTFTAAAVLAHAHFVFIVPEPGSTQAKLFISEQLKPDGEVDFAMVSGAKLSLRDASGRDTPLELSKGTDAFLLKIAGSGTRIVHGVADLGFSGRPGAKAYVLIYHPKTIVGNAFAGKVTLGGTTPVELVPTGKPGAVKLQLIARGKPLPNTEVTLILPGGGDKKVMTDANGFTEALPQTGRFGAWARFWEPSAGERDGKKYEEVRHYATLVFDADAAPATASAPAPFAVLPQASASLGAIADGGWLYVYGGHITPTHMYSTASVSGEFHRMKLSAPGTWETLPAGPAVQGMNLAAYGGKIYRIGGMSPRNAPGQPADTHSIADCARFDPSTMKWEALPPMPEARSSHDVVVIDGKLIVAAGWTMQGKLPTKWMDTVLTMDLNAPKLEWKSAPQPFKRRALTAAAHNGKMYVMGGIDEKNAVSNEVDIYDARTGAWSKGPVVPGSGNSTFAPAAVAHGGELFVSVADGTLYRLDESKKQWTAAGRASARLAHRLVSSDGGVLVVGRAIDGHNLDSVEAIAVSRAAAK